MSRLKQDALKCFATSRRLQAPLIQAWLTCPEINLCALDSSSRTEMLDVGRRGSLPNRLSKHGHSTPRNTNHPVDGARYLQETKKLECLIHRLNTGHLRHDREDLNSMWCCFEVKSEKAQMCFLKCVCVCLPASEVFDPKVHSWMVALPIPATFKRSRTDGRWSVLTRQPQLPKHWSESMAPRAGMVKCRGNGAAWCLLKK